MTPSCTLRRVTVSPRVRPIPRLLSIDEYADKTSVSRATVYRWLKRNASEAQELRRRRQARADAIEGLLAAIVSRRVSVAAQARKAGVSLSTMYRWTERKRHELAIERIRSKAA